MFIKGDVANVTCKLKKNWRGKNRHTSVNSYRTHKAYIGTLDCLRHNDVRDNETQWYIVCMAKESQ